MFYRLELRVIDDFVEDMIRVLKFIMVVKRKLIFFIRKESLKFKKFGFFKFGCVKFCIRKLIVDVEEELM